MPASFQWTSIFLGIAISFQANAEGAWNPKRENFYRDITELSTGGKPVGDRDSLLMGIAPIEARKEVNRYLLEKWAAGRIDAATKTRREKLVQGEVVGPVFFTTHQESSMQERTARLMSAEARGPKKSIVVSLASPNYKLENGSLLDATDLLQISLGGELTAPIASNDLSFAGGFLEACLGSTIKESVAASCAKFDKIAVNLYVDYIYYTVDVGDDGKTFRIPATVNLSHYLDADSRKYLGIKDGTYQMYDLHEGDRYVFQFDEPAPAPAIEREGSRVIMSTTGKRQECTVKVNYIFCRDQTCAGDAPSSAGAKAASPPTAN